jgi:hypothetical protein
MTKARKNQINARVDDETDEALKRLAAATGAPVGSLCSQVLTDYVANQQQTPSGAFDLVSQQFDERLAEHDRRLVREVEAIIKPIKRELTVIKAQIDMVLECMAPERRADYQQGVAKLIQTNGVAR